jgi:hypothetical protein
VHKLRCGIIYTDAFADYLNGLYTKNTALQHSKIALLEYVRLAGTQQQHWNIQWVHESTLPAENRFSIGSIPVGIAKATQRGLKHRCLDYKEGSVFIL